MTKKPSVSPSVSPEVRAKVLLVHALSLAVANAATLLVIKWKKRNAPPAPSSISNLQRRVRSGASA